MTTKTREENTTNTATARRQRREADEQLARLPAWVRAVSEAGTYDHLLAGIDGLMAQVFEGGDRGVRTDLRR